MLHPDDYEVAMKSMRDHMNGQSEVYEVEYRMRAKDGSWHWYHDRGKITKRDENEEPVYMSGIVFDVTNKKKNELILEKENIKLKIESGTDALTGIPNRRALIEKLIDDMSVASGGKKPLTIAMIDLDHFKLINDSRGHVFGDRVLKQIASLISESLREFDTVGRYGGEEFLVILPATGIKNAQKVAQRIRKNIEAHVFEDDSKVTVSIGLKEFENESIEEFIDKADMKLYKAKNSGRNRVEA
jgi:diguanylate cyclase (GGDEF)-like protein